MDDNIINIFKKTGALLEGHFILTSGRHSPTYFQCAKVLQYPEYLTKFASMIADNFRNTGFDTIISPAIGGIVIGTEVGRQLGFKTIFAERKDGIMKIRRGFSICAGERFLVVEDVITTGGSVRELINLIKNSGGLVTGVGVVVDRSNGAVKLHENQYSVTRQKAVSYLENDIPDWLDSIPPSKPGSRK